MLQTVCGEAVATMRGMTDASFDLIIADPPYNLGKDYGNHSDKQQFEVYLQFTREWTAEATRLLKDSGTLYVLMGFR